MAKIAKVWARQILDSRGNPSLEVDVTLDNGIVGHAAVPSGASTGEREACELRDGDKKTYLGKGTLTAVKNVNTKIAKKIVGMDPSKQTEVDDAMIELDGNRMLKNTLGANAILGVSMAVCVAAAKDAGLPLYQYIAKLHGTEKLTLPCPMCNVINGGAHSSAPIDFQEFMIAPVGAKTFSKGLQMVTEIFHALKAVLKKGGFDTTVGDEGGFAPGVAIKPAKNKFGYEIKDVMTLEKALAALKTATENAGYVFGKDIKIALDVASSEFCDKETEKEGSKAVTYTFKKSTKKTVKSADMVKLYEKLIDKYSIFSIEDGLDEADWAGWKVLTDKLGGKINLVGDDLFVTNGDDLFVTNPTIFDEGIKAGIANAILIKVNQVGSVSETLAAIKRAQVEGYAPIVSHRSGETEDTFIADLAVGTAAGQIKTGSLSRTDRVCKYNRLLRIEEELGKAAVYAGDPRKGAKAPAKKAPCKKGCKK